MDGSVVERVARAIATGHGGQMVFMPPDDQMQTVASLHGFGRMGDSASRYSDAFWRQYVVAAQFAIEAMAQSQTELVDGDLMEALNGGGL